jgi:1-phosphatidylinositol-4-phosphate 5-kinase
LGEGASGSFFFFSEDKKFIMKTMTEAEVERMQEKLKTYLEHVLKKNSIIAKILGIFKIKMDRFSPIFVMIMENTIPNIKNYELHYVFDMKGSQINREVLSSLPIKDLNKPTGD